VIPCHDENTTRRTPVPTFYCFVPIGFFTSVALPAWTMLLYWMALQRLGGLVSGGGEQGGVAFWAHAGGFLAGVVLVKLFARPANVDAHRRGTWTPSRVSARW
jgi:membrane associated rhomboid family serine protease